MDNQIIQTVSAIFSGADEHNWAKIQDALADTVLLDYHSMSGNPAAVLTPKQITDMWAGFLPGFDKTNHQLSDFQIKRKGDIATAHFVGKANHYIDNDVWIVEGTYDAEVVQDNAKWVVNKLTFNFLEQSGNINLPSKAIEKLTGKS
jgi:hypothetical protein